MAELMALIHTPQQIEKAELWISHILRWGVLVCACVILAGWVTSNSPIIMAGLLMLIFLPIARVFAAAIIFFRQKDFVYVALSLFVLAVLLTSLILGKKI